MSAAITCSRPVAAHVDPAVGGEDATTCAKVGDGSVCGCHRHVGEALAAIQQVLEQESAPLTSSLGALLLAALLASEDVLRRIAPSAEWESAFLHRHGGGGGSGARWWWQPENRALPALGDAPNAEQTADSSSFCTETLRRALAEKDPAATAAANTYGGAWQLCSAACGEHLRRGLSAAVDRSSAGNCAHRVTVPEELLARAWLQEARLRYDVAVLLERWHTNSPSFLTKTPAPLAKLTGAFRCCVEAVDASRVCISQIAHPNVSAEADAFLTGVLRPALQRCEFPAAHLDTASADSDSVQCFLHEAAELSANTLRVSQGIGVVATADIQEGAILCREAPLVWWTRNACEAASPSDGTKAAEQQLREQLYKYAQSGSCGASRVAMRRLLTLTGYVASRTAHVPSKDAVTEVADVLLEDFAATAVLDSVAVSLRVLDSFKVGMEALPAEQGRSAWGTLREGERGKALCHNTRFFNHSCVPNALVVSSAEVPLSSGRETPTLAVVALRDIEIGEEITVSYLALPLTDAATKRETLGFDCRCDFCATKTPLLEGVCCGECGKLVDLATAPCDREDSTAKPAGHIGVDNRDEALRASGGCRTHGGAGADEDDKNADEPGAALPYQHSTDCTWVPRKFKEAAEASVRNTQRALAAATRRMMMAGEEGGADDVLLRMRRGMQELLDLDACAGAALLSTHHVRLSARMQVMALFAASAGPGTSRAQCAPVLQLTADLLEDVELLLAANEPLLTDLRMFYVLCRSRYAAAATAEERLASGARTDECCGAVRHEMSVLGLPYVVDVVIRECVARCFQEHYLQLSAFVTDEEAVQAFMRRFPHELEAAGIRTQGDMDMLSLM